MMVMRAVMSERWQTEVNKIMMMMTVAMEVTMLNKNKDPSRRRWPRQCLTR